MQDDKIVSLINRVGVPLVYSVTVNEDGSQVDAEVTAAQADKLTTLLGEKAVKLLRVKGTHVIVRVKVAELEKAAAEAQKVARGSGVQVKIISWQEYRIEIKSESAPNAITEAWWAADTRTGGITVNGVEYPIIAGHALDYYKPEGEDDSDWERTVYVVKLPIVGDELVLTSYGVTNLIRRVASRNERIG
jgi:hypothetical protein